VYRIRETFRRECSVQLEITSKIPNGPFDKKVGPKGPIDFCFKYILTPYLDYIILPYNMGVLYGFAIKEAGHVISKKDN
jgi:hypothetical protein